MDNDEYKRIKPEFHLIPVLLRHDDTRNFTINSEIATRLIDFLSRRVEISEQNENTM